MNFLHHDKHADAHDQVTNSPHKAALSHELLASAASYEAMKAYEKHVKDQGHPDSHAKAKEMIATLSGGFIDRMVETKGLDAIDKEKAKRQASAHADSQLPSE
ncbi:hypothetical protein CONPUDRAFT_170000 [Coniophora puteana RWD-64-598 SS2]|uniref:Uncharacterized protein n=1 Tax=Coniophora puteana (strain RWD-64-598) TaxID=741705 RepID=R7SFX8_CONPW|nr:uncharacterized protein CONPUDRAFT_170000 [Coniophora puteana RWD-64-598 SS2]EIW74647.1 hypothetical protein CONPUDRAFT_170000 [Coniophora puteana RWD-64-598 SS2]